MLRLCGKKKQTLRVSASLRQNKQTTRVSASLRQNKQNKHSASCISLLTPSNMRYVLLLLLLPLSLSAQNKRYFVKSDAPGVNNGQSWTDAFLNLHDALFLAQSGDEIWVGEGTYRPSETGDRNSYFRMPSGVLLYGGFAGTEMLPEERDWVQHPTVLSGDIGMAGDKSDNSYNILYAFQPDSSTLIDGFILREGNANKPGITGFQLGAYGAGLLINGFDGVAYLTVRHCRFERNTARASGGAVCVNGSGTGSAAPVFEDCVFADNSCGNAGGAVYRIGGSWVDRPADFLNCRFERNQANAGGALYYRDSERTDTLDIRNCHFEANGAIGRADAIAFGLPRKSSFSAMHLRGSVFENHVGLGKSLLLLDVMFEQGNFDMMMDSCHYQNNDNATTLQFELDGVQNLIIKNSMFNNNNLSFQLGDLSVTGNSKTRMENLIFEKNSKTTIYNIFIKPKIKKSLLNCNSDLIIGSDAPIDNSQIENCIFTNNKFIDIGIFLIDSYSTARPSIINSAFIGNVIESKNGTAKIDISNSLFYNNKKNNVGAIPFTYTTLCFSNCLIHLNNPDELNKYITRCPLGPGNLIDIDPLLIDTAAGNFHLSPCSPAVDAGSNAATLAAGLLTDLDGAPRIQNGRVDMGAYETSGVLSAINPVIRAACIGQANGSLLVRATGGCPPYRVQWSNGTRTDSILTGLEPGSYRLSITDSRGRTATATAEIPVSDPQLTFTGDSIVCPGAADARLQLITGGTPALPVQYRWQDNNSAAPERNNLAAGYYEAVVTDLLGCRDSAAVTVSATAPPRLDTVVVAATLPLANNGILSVQPAGAFAPYHFRWSNGDTLARIENLPPGRYTLTLTDREGCTYTSAYTVSAIVATSEPRLRPSGRVWPNPTSGGITLAFEHSDEWRLYYPSGSLAGTSSGTTTPDLSALPAGIYWYVFLRKGEGGKRGKLVKVAE